MQRKMTIYALENAFMASICIYGLDNAFMASKMHVCTFVYPMTSQMMMQEKWEDKEGHQMPFSKFEEIDSGSIINWL